MTAELYKTTCEKIHECPIRNQGGLTIKEENMLHEILCEKYSGLCKYNQEKEKR